MNDEHLFYQQFFN